MLTKTELSRNGKKGMVKRWGYSVKGRSVNGSCRITLSLGGKFTHFVSEGENNGQVLLNCLNKVIHHLHA